MNSISLLNKQLLPATTVTFPKGSMRETSIIVNGAKLDNDKMALFFRTTPFHPINRFWPDQPSDRGAIILGNKKIQLIDCETYVFDPATFELQEAHAISRKNRKEGNVEVVGHIINNDDFCMELLGQEAVIEVDKDYRIALSKHHSAVHLAALALNYVLKSYWQKNISDIDSLGSPNFDKMAIEKSSITSNKAEDLYRFGKTIKKQGLKVEDLLRDLESIQQKVNYLLSDWIKLDQPIEILTENNLISDTRKWRCVLPIGSGRAEIPCGGTHVTRLNDMFGVNYSLKIIEEVDKANKAEKKLLAITQVF